MSENPRDWLTPEEMLALTEGNPNVLTVLGQKNQELEAHVAELGHEVHRLHQEIAALTERLDSMEHMDRTVVRAVDGTDGARSPEHSPETTGKPPENVNVFPEPETAWMGEDLPDESARWAEEGGGEAGENPLASRDQTEQDEEPEAGSLDVLGHASEPGVEAGDSWHVTERGETQPDNASELTAEAELDSAPASAAEAAEPAVAELDSGRIVTESSESLTAGPEAGTEPPDAAEATEPTGPYERGQERLKAGPEEEHGSVVEQDRLDAGPEELGSMVEQARQEAAAATVPDPYVEVEPELGEPPTEKSADPFDGLMVSRSQKHGKKKRRSSGFLRGWFSS